MNQPACTLAPRRSYRDQRARPPLLFAAWLRALSVVDPEPLAQSNVRGARQTRPRQIRGHQRQSLPWTTYCKNCRPLRSLCGASYRSGLRLSMKSVAFSTTSGRSRVASTTPCASLADVERDSTDDGCRRAARESPLSKRRPSS